MTKRPSRNLTVTPREFIAAWQKGESLAEVARDLGVTPTSAQQRASTYRKQGVMLKHFPRTHANYLDWDELRKFAAQFNTDE